MVSVNELKKDIENDEDIMLILRKALDISSKFGLDDYETWISSELQGYSNPKLLPNYRIIECEVLYKVVDRFIGGVTLNPVEVGLRIEFNEMLKTMFLKKPISLIDEYCKTQKDPIQFKVPNSVNETVNKFSKVNVEIYRQFPIAKLKNIIEQVKNTLYGLCLELEKDQSYMCQSTQNYEEFVKNINFNTVIFNIQNINQIISNKYEYIMSSIVNEDIDETIKVTIIENVNIMEKEIEKDEPDVEVLQKSGNVLKELTMGISSSLIAQGIISFVDFIFKVFCIIPPH